MPYYKEINTLFIHIPKTGGTGLEEYLRTRYTESVFSHVPNDNFLNPTKSLQHQPYSFLYEYRNELDIPFETDDFKIITVVRNPYNRIISDLVFFGLIDYDSTPDEVCTTIKNYLGINKDQGYTIYMKEGLWIFNEENDYDNHRIPQSVFLSNFDLKTEKTIKIFKTESLTKEIIEYGFTDYEFSTETRNYMNYLNNESIQIINEYYKRDFELFGYYTISY